VKTEKNQMSFYFLFTPLISLLKKPPSPFLSFWQLLTSHSDPVKVQTCSHQAVLESEGRTLTSKRGGGQQQGEEREEGVR